jgi:hypothetical protein
MKGLSGWKGGFVGVHWQAGLMRWRPHVDGNGQAHPLHHLHPFRFEFAMPASGGRPETGVLIHVGFGLHCFTRQMEAGDDPYAAYSDDREQRTFDHHRYKLSKQLPGIIKGLPKRRCAFAKANNYVTIELGESSGVAMRYGVFFNIRRWEKQGDNAVLIVVQSAYALDPTKQIPGVGRIGFQALVGHALRGTKPHPSR